MFATRRAVIAVSVLGALGFVLARVFYRVLFGGSRGGATVLPSLAPVRLGGPFSHITLFGPLTLEGLAGAALSALPFAGVIFVTGVLVALVDPRRVIMWAPKLRWGSSLVLSLGIAISTFPVILRSVQIVKKYASLRGLKPGFRVVLPVLETTLERAMSFAAALESRGIRSAASRAPGRDSKGILRFVDFSVPGRLDEPVTWTVEPGSRIVLTGATGCGKTTLVETAAGLLDLRGVVETTGSLVVEVAPEAIAYIPHEPHSLFLTSRVIDDVALGLLHRGYTAAEAQNLARASLEHHSAIELADRAPHTLSSGEAAWVALVMVLATRPQLIALDEPLGALDDHRHQDYLDVLAEYRDEVGATVIMTDHPRAPSTPGGWEVCQMGPGGITPGRFVQAPDAHARNPVVPPEPDTVLNATGITVGFGERQVLRNVSLEVARGEILLITGDNGAGKSTLLDALATGSAGVVTVLGRTASAVSGGQRAKAIAVVPSAPGALFMTSSVQEELVLADRIAGVPRGFTELSCESLIPGFVALHRHTHPRDVSQGQQAALAVALQMSHKPTVLLLDEPTRGLDDQARAAFAEVVACVVETGTAVVIAAHHRDGGGVAPTRVLRLREGSLFPAGVEVTR